MSNERQHYMHINYIVHWYLLPVAICVCANVVSVKLSTIENIWDVVIYQLIWLSGLPTGWFAMSSNVRC